MTTFRAVRLLVLLGAMVGCAATQAQNLAFLGTHTLDARWELEDSLRNGTFLITPYRPVYVMPAVWSSSPNYSPQRTTEAVSPLPAPIPLNDVECKFQLSFKTKVVQGLFNDKGDVWVAYTQSSRWQLYNTDLSWAFRETNYEPEAFGPIPPSTASWASTASSWRSG
ncbi:MAG: phospholipase A [Flavobacteriales bacterium]|nr:phospholipase A [Flavobacteriales bacterium]